MTCKNFSSLGEVKTPLPLPLEPLAQYRCTTAGLARVGVLVLVGVMVRVGVVAVHADRRGSLVHVQVMRGRMNVNAS